MHQDAQKHLCRTVTLTAATFAAALALFISGEPLLLPVALVCALGAVGSGLKFYDLRDEPAARQPWQYE